MQVRITIQNIVASAKIDQGFDLNEIAVKFPDAKYEPEVFPGLIFKMQNPKSCILFFKTGKMVCTGTKKDGDAKKLVEKILEKFSKIGLIKAPYLLEISIQNMVAKVELNDTKIDIENAYFFLNEYGRMIYDPEIFPGIIYYLKEPKVTFLIFHQGKLVCTGAKKEEDIEKAVGKLQIILEKSNLLLPNAPQIQRAFLLFFYFI